MLNQIQYILTDIEGTTTSVSFVYDVLFPCFRNNIRQLEKLKSDPTVEEAFEEIIRLAKQEGSSLNTTSEVIDHLLKWSLEDKKITPLKTLQGILWREAYQSGNIKGHIYPDVPLALKKWKDQNIRLGVFSSGSVEAQKLIFGYSESGDLTPYFSHYFDTKTGGKRDTATYQKIAEVIQLEPVHILFLSDITEELEAARNAGYQTIQLVREGTKANWGKTVSSFSEIN